MSWFYRTFARPALFVQDKWQAGRGLTLNYGLRWDSQRMPKTVDPKTTAYARFLGDPRFPSDGTAPLWRIRCRVRKRSTDSQHSRQ